MISRAPRIGFATGSWRRPTLLQRRRHPLQRRQQPMTTTASILAGSGCLALLASPALPAVVNPLSIERQLLPAHLGSNPTGWRPVLSRTMAAILIVAERAIRFSPPRTP